METIKKPEWTKRQQDEIQEFIFGIKELIRNYPYKDSYMNENKEGFEPAAFIVKYQLPKREETRETLMLYTQLEIGIIHPDNLIYWDLTVDGENFQVRDFEFTENEIVFVVVKCEV